MRHASAGEIQYKNAGAEHCQSNSRPGQHHESHVGLKRGQGAMKQWEAGQKKGGKSLAESRMGQWRGLIAGVAREVNSTRDQLLHDQISADQLFTRSTSLSQLL